MSSQRRDEWINYDDRQLDYHRKQWDDPKFSTVAFYEFVKDRLDDGETVVDLGAGTGAVTAYMAERHNRINFVAADFVEDFLQIGKNIAKKRDLQNLTFEQMDWLNLQSDRRFGGVISSQTLSWLNNPSVALGQVFDKFKPNWFALTSLFYEGDITCTIEIEEHQIGRKSFYNIYSLPEINRIAKNHGYSITRHEKFKMPVDIQAPDDQNYMGTYTRRIEDDIENPERLQISGPLLMPWYMLMFERV